MSKTLLPLNTCADGTALSLVAGYYKFYLATFFRWGGTAGTCIAEVCEDEEGNTQNIEDVYGLSRTRDYTGTVIKRTLNPYVNCLHASCGGGFENMWVLVVEVYEGLCDTIREDRSDEATPSGDW